MATETTQKTYVILLGTVIKLNRLAQNMSQATLAQGICVPSYLSKIENGELMASDEILKLLFHQLDLKYHDEPTFIIENKQVMQTYYKHLSDGQFESANKIFESLFAKENELMTSSLIVDYFLIKLAHLSGSSDRQNFEFLKKQLNQVITSLTTDQQYYYYYYAGLDAIVYKNEHKENVHYLKQALALKESGESYYFLGISYFKVGRYYEAIEAVEKAQVLYFQKMRIAQLILCYELKAMIAYRLHSYAIAKRDLQRANELGQQLNRQDLRLNVVSFLAYVNYAEASYEAAIHHLHQAIEIKKTLNYESDIMILLNYLSISLDQPLLNESATVSILSTLQTCELSEFNQFVYDYLTKPTRQLMVEVLLFDLVIHVYTKHRRYKECSQYLQTGYLDAKLFKC